MKTTTSFRKSRGESVRLLQMNTLFVFVENVAHFRRGPVAQRLEQSAHNRLVVGSTPTGPTSNNQ